MKDKNHMISSLDAEMTFDTTQYPFMVKVSETLGIQEEYSCIIKSMNSKSTANISPNGEKLKAFSLK